MIRVAAHRGGTWLLPFHRLVPLPGALPSMRLAASWLWVQDPTEYKVVAQDLAPVGWLCSELFNINVGHLGVSRVGMLRLKARADARPLRGYGLDPSASPLFVARHSVGANRRRSAIALRCPRRCA
jgi:hypothetical protein